MDYAELIKNLLVIKNAMFICDHEFTTGPIPTEEQVQLIREMADKAAQLARSFND